MKPVKIEILETCPERATWFNQFVGQKFEAVDCGGYFRLTQKSINEVNTKEGRVTAIQLAVSREYAEIDGEKIKKHQMQTIFLYPRGMNHLREARRFVVNKTINKTDRRGNVIGTILNEGDVYEEMFDKPNHIAKVLPTGYIESISLKEINQSSQLLPAFDIEEEMVCVKTTRYFEAKEKTLKTSFNKTVKSFSKTKIKLQELAYLLGCEDDLDNILNHEE